MRIALVHDYLVQFGGAERTLCALAELFPDAPIYTFLYDREKMAPWFAGKDVRVSVLDKLPKRLKKNHRMLLPFFPLASALIDLSAFDVVISSSSSFAKGVRVRSGAVHISYCYSPTRFLWDYKERYKEDNRLGFLARMMLAPLSMTLRMWDRRVARNVHVWIAISRTVKERIKKYYGADAKIIYPPVDVPLAVPVRGRIYATGYFLVVSRLTAYKKIDLVIQTFNAIQLPLVIVGTGPELAHLRRMAHSNVIFRGFIDDDELAATYQNCMALIVSCEEDFGLTAAEAAQYGKPTLAYQKGGIAEWLEPGKTGEFFEEQTPESIAQGVYRIRAHAYDASYLEKKSRQFSKKTFQDAIVKVVVSALDAQRK